MTAAEWFIAWAVKPLAEAVGAALVVVAVCAWWLVVEHAPRWWRQARCRHEGDIYETQACDAVCRRCGKNLGFIGQWRNGRQP